MATPEEIRRAREQSSIFSNLFDYVRANDAQLASEGRRPVLGGLLSKEPVMGTDTIRYEGLGPMLAGLLSPIARGVDAPRAAAQGLIPQEDMVGEAFGTAGTAMLGGGAVAKPAGSLGMNVLRDTPNEMRSNQVLVRIPVKDVGHGESAMPGGKLTWPDAPKLIEEYAQKDTDLPPIEIMADEGGMAMIADGSHRFEAAKLRGQDYVEAYVNADDLAELPSAEVLPNTLRVYHGGDYRYGDDINAPFFVTPDRKGAEYFAPNDVPFTSVSNFEADLSNALDIDTPSGQARLSEILTKHGIEHDYNPDGVYEKIDIYDVPDDVSYDGTNLLDAAYIPKVQDALKKEGVSALYSSADALENSSIPAYAVVDPTILGANASKPIGLLVLEQQARGNKDLGDLFKGQGMNIDDLSAADPMAVQGVLDMAQKRGILDPRSVFSLKRGLLD